MEMLCKANNGKSDEQLSCVALFITLVASNLRALKSVASKSVSFIYYIVFYEFLFRLILPAICHSVFFIHYCISVVLKI